MDRDPAARVQESELKKLADLESVLKSKVIGQDEAVEAVAAAVRRSRVQISPRRRPASFIFVGPTGVGKTELVKVLSQELFDSPETLIRLDMSELWRSTRCRESLVRRRAMSAMTRRDR